MVKPGGPPRRLGRANRGAFHASEGRGAAADRCRGALCREPAARHRDGGSRTARPRRGAGPHRGGRALPLGPVGDQRRPAAAAADGAGPRGGRHHRGARRGRDRPRARRPCRDGLHAELRPLPALRRGPSGAVRAGRGRQRRRYAAGRRDPPVAGRRAAAPSSRRLGLRRPRGDVGPFAGQNRPRPAARRGRAVRLRGPHRGRASTRRSFGPARPRW
jgi:hypothetical protein